MPSKNDHSALEDHSLWELLDRAPRPQVKGRFVDDVLRRIRQENESHPTFVFRIWLSQSWKAMAGLSAATALLVSGIAFQGGQVASTSLAASETRDFSALIASVPVNGLAVLGDLDSAPDDNDIWLGTDSY